MRDSAGRQISNGTQISRSRLLLRKKLEWFRLDSRHDGELDPCALARLGIDNGLVSILWSTHYNL